MDQDMFFSTMAASSDLQIFLITLSSSGVDSSSNSKAFLSKKSWENSIMQSFQGLELGGGPWPRCAKGCFVALKNSSLCG